MNRISVQAACFGFFLSVSMLFIQQASATILTIGALYERVNIRSFSNSLTAALENNCHVYPKDFFIKRGRWVSSREMEFSKGIHQWNIKVKSGNQIELIMRVGSTKIERPDLIQLFYDEGNKEWFSREMNVALPRKCNEISAKKRSLQDRQQELANSDKTGKRTRQPSQRNQSNRAGKLRFTADRSHVHNRWKSQASYVSHYQLPDATVWKDELILPGSRLANFGVDCKPSYKVPCRSEALLISRVNLVNGRHNTVRERQPTVFKSGRTTHDTTRRVSNNHLIDLTLIRDRRNVDTLVQVTELNSGKLVFSHRIPYAVIDAAVSESTLTFSHRAPGKGGAFKVSIHRMSDASVQRVMAMKNRPILTDRNIVRYEIHDTRGPTAQVSVFMHPVDTGKGHIFFKGKWPRAGKTCPKVDRKIVNDSSRFISLIDRCNTIRIIDLAKKRLKSYDAEQSGKDNHVGTENFLLMSDAGTNESQTIDLRNGQLANDRFPVNAGQLISAGRGQDAVVSVIRNKYCVNPYADENTGVVQRNEYITQRIQIEKATRQTSKSKRSRKSKRFPIVRAMADGKPRGYPRNKASRDVIAMKRVNKVGELDMQSVGEFRINFSSNANRQHWNRAQVTYRTFKNRFCEVIQTPLYGADRRTRIGWFGAELSKSAVDSPKGRIWVTDRDGRELTALADMSRHYESRSLMVFEVADGGWYNLSADPSRPLWIGGPNLPRDFHKQFTDRTTVIAQASRILVRSGHRVRSGPGVDYEEVETIHPDTPLTIVPVKAIGDWLKVKFGQGHNRENWRSGWLKWRGAPGDEWVRAEHGTY